MQLVINNDLKELSRTNETICNFLNNYALSSRSQYVIHLVLEELLTNIIKYAYDDQSRHEISLDLAIDDRTATLRLIDNGLPFNPLKVQMPDITLPPDERKPGGLGIYLIRQLAKDIQYQRQGDKNVVVVTIAIATKKAGRD